ncbi:MAG: histidine ammonia-lyase [Thermoproteota archaeon]|nr:MAG: histidine ammonia-lyase [Candidatus Korarchaeota archaeon]
MLSAASGGVLRAVLVDGSSLTVDDVAEVAFGKARVEIAIGVQERVEEARRAIVELTESGAVVYGVTTGFGALASHRVSPREACLLQRNLILSHSTGVGRELPKEAVRAMMLVRLNTLAKGYSGVRYRVLELLAEALNRDLVPVVPEKGSVGASGDLAPLSHMALALMGEGEAYWRGRRVRGEELKKALRELGGPLELSYKEGLALNNGTPATAGLACLLIHEGQAVAELADLALAMTMEALLCSTDPLNSRLHELRPHRGQAESAKLARAFLAGSCLVGSSSKPMLREMGLSLAELVELEGSPEGTRVRLSSRLLSALGVSSAQLAEAITLKTGIRAHAEGKYSLGLVCPVSEARELLSEMDFTRAELGRVQDAYSIRCAPVVHGALREALSFARRIVEVEINSVSDNPVIMPDSREVLSGANFHGQPLALALDTLAIALTYVSLISERRVFRLLDPALNRGLPPFLIEGSGLKTGLMITQYTAAALASESKVLAHPASADTIPTSANQEDHVSMSMTAALKARKILENTKTVLAIELLNASQAISLRLEAAGLSESCLGAGTKAAYSYIGELLGLPIREDRPYSRDIIRVRETLPEILDAARGKLAD